MTSSSTFWGRRLLHVGGTSGTGIATRAAIGPSFLHKASLHPSRKLVAALPLPDRAKIDISRSVAKQIVDAPRQSPRKKRIQVGCRSVAVDEIALVSLAPLSAYRQRARSVGKACFSANVLPGFVVLQGAGEKYGLAASLRQRPRFTRSLA